MNNGPRFPIKDNTEKTDTSATFFDLHWVYMVETVVITNIVIYKLYNLQN